ncbi:DUF3857 and transglutaminase domain-containing protein [Algoriphagus sp. H41]|uniref:DUF3857 and transglutaminase domain-containing protein n=1 Tax=Algoriphagus oliviformis TaxID=2811231 RepID=A0ABS3BYW4_9BACT|nr:DUF3857 domain-containing protein [Algoriphagus oliviformis]MBN7809591.1 DUF3857 and transglutaminase domain-containing protein [Algoriphagus oliviformis]
MSKPLFLALAMLLPFLSHAQSTKMGEISQEEFDLAEISYEPGAAAAYLVSFGDSRIYNGTLETQYFHRIKILSEAGKEQADIRIRYYAGTNNVENISGMKAQITHLEGGKPVVTKLGKDDFFDVDLGDGVKEFRISFPNAQVGSILEYTYKKGDKNIEFLDGWTFQKTMPVVYSEYQIKIPEHLEYKTIGQGANLYSRSERKSDYGYFSWILRDLYGLKEEPFMRNYRDYVDRVEFQLSRYMSGSGNGYSGAAQWTDFLHNWEKLGDELIDYYSTKGFYRSNPIEREMLSLDLTAGSQKDKAKAAYYYVRDNFINEGADWIYTNQTLPQLLKSKKGAPGELILAYMGILKSLGIECNPVLIGSKGYGRSQIVPFPFLNQFDEILLIANLDGEQQFLDLSDPMAPFGYVDLDKHVSAGLMLQRNASKLIPIDIRHASNKLVFSSISLNAETGELVMDNAIRNSYYEGLAYAHRVKNLTDGSKPMEDLFKERYEAFEIRNVTVSDQLEERNNFSVQFQSVMKDAAAQDLLVFNPLQISDFAKNPFTQDFRVFPVDFEYSFRETYTANIVMPAGYELDDYPTDEMITIPGSPIGFTYQTENLGEIVKITAKFEVRDPMIQPDSYGDLKFFMESVAAKLTAPVILKRTAQ